jgi:hypothetical protein
MPEEDLRAFQKRFFQALRDRPLDVSDPADAALYEPLHDKAHDPVRRLYDTIEFSVGESVQLVAGFRGTGKTTEFSRLEQHLWGADHLVIRVDLDDYLDLYSPVDITDFLLVLAGAIGDRLRDERLLGWKEGVKRGFWGRAKDLLSPSLALESTGMTAGPLSLQLGLKADPTVRKRVREALKGQIPRLVQEVRLYHEQTLGFLRDKWGQDTRLVVIVDSLEHIRGTSVTARDVYASVQDLFFGHARHLQLPSTHMVLSVPAFLALQADNLAAQFANGAVQVWSSCRVRNRDGTPDRDTVDRLVRLVERRGEWQRVLPDRTALEKVILGSGGYLRDLLNMLIEAIHQATDGVGPDAAERILEVTRRSYQPLYADEVQVLRRIAEARDLGAVKLEERDFLLRFLDSHLVLAYLNGTFWYDVHPLVRDRVL